MADKGDTTEKRKTIYITWPSEGGTKTVAKGDVVLDVWEGTVRLPDGEEERLSDKLRGSGHKYARTIFVDNPTQDVTISLDGGGKYEIKANTLRGIIWQEFRLVKITTTTSTDLKVFISTHGAGGIVAA